MNFAGGRMHFDAPPAIAHAGPKGMFPLLLDYDRDVRANFAGNGFRGEVKVC